MPLLSTIKSKKDILAVLSDRTLKKYMYFKYYPVGFSPYYSYQYLINNSEYIKIR